MARGGRIPTGDIASMPGERGRASLKKSRKIWGREQPMEASLMPLSGKQHSTVGKSQDRVSQASVMTLTLSHTCSMTLGNLLLVPSCLICKMGLLIQGVVRLNLDIAY